MQGAEEEQYAGRLPLGHASGDANAWLHWILWGHGAYTVDKDDKVIINSPETAKALNTARRCPTPSSLASRPGTTRPTTRRSWPASCICTNNGISIYVAAKDDPTKKELADDTYHACGQSVRSASRPNCSCACRSWRSSSPSPRTPQGLHRLHAGEGELREWLSGARGYLTHTLNAYDTSPVWTADPKARCSARPASGRCRPPASASRARRRRPPSPTSWWSTCSPTTAPAARTSRVPSPIAERQLKRIYR